MNLHGILESLDIDGYERTLGIRCGDVIFYCGALQPDEYLESGSVSKKLKLGEAISVDIALSLARLLAIDGNEEEVPGVVQNIIGSPYAIVTGEVRSILGEDSCLVGLPAKNDLPVEFEVAVKLQLNSRVRIVGELTVIDE